MAKPLHTTTHGPFYPPSSPTTATSSVEFTLFDLLDDDADAAMKQPTTDKKKCNCPIDVLMIQGCQCGGR